MEVDAGFYNREDEKQETSQWQLSFSSFPLQLERRSSKYKNVNQKHHVNLVKKQEWSSHRRVVQATKFERLSYYRTYVASANKAHYICLKNIQFNWFFWYYIINLFLKSLPHSYLYFFLASYAPEEHLFMTKMVPISYGFQYTFVMAGFTEVMGSIDSQIMLFDYVINGLLYRNPWNRCLSNRYVRKNITIHCYNFTEFSKKFVNESVTVVENFYVDSSGEVFQVAQIEFYQNKSNLWETDIAIVYFIAILLLAGLFHTQVYNKLFWKILNVIQWTINTIDVLSFMFLWYTEFAVDSQILSSNVIHNADTEKKFDNSLWDADIDMLAESTTAPPVVHVLTARSIQDIEPNRDSAIMITSNAFLYVFRVSLVEVLVIYWMYPVERLLDDITFRYGLSPTRFRILNLRIVPVYYLFKCYLFIKYFVQITIKANFGNIFKYYFWTWSIILIPVLFGGLYIILVYVFKYKKSWLLVFSPDCCWGPKDPIVLYLRKLYDSRVYIRCQATRILSRYLISKSEPKEYVLDINYNESLRTTAINTATLQSEVEKESKKSL
uniref:Uncharacterized protein n=1 Tax=Bombyx mori TaxID=7091 RepID=A0A8R2DQ84_BOMMO|nr:uncharacterized protein LOC101735575 [Bombyx mori]